MLGVALRARVKMEQNKLEVIQTGVKHVEVVKKNNSETLNQRERSGESHRREALIKGEQVPSVN